MKTSRHSLLLMVLILIASHISNAQSNISTNSLWVTINNENAVPYELNGKLVSDDAEINQLIQEYAIVTAEKALPDSRKKALQKVYEVTCFCNADKLAEVMNRSTAFSQAERAPEYELLSTPLSTDDYTLNFSQDYALDLINAEQAWGYTTGDTSVILGISDGSFLEQHEDLASEYVSVINSQGVSMNMYYHGTAVAITAAGATNNTAGKSAIGYDCKMALNTLGYNQMLQLSYGGAKVINASWSSGCFYSSYYQSVVDEILENESIIVASAGNGGTCGGAQNLVYPASLEGVISVTSVGPQDNHERHIGDPTSTHQHNAAVDLCAPGYDVALTIAPGVYMTGNGSSFAAPYVTGTIGLMLSLRPCLTATEVENILKLTAVDIYGQNANYQGMLGAGRLDAGAAIEHVFNMGACNSGGNNPVIGVGSTPPLTSGVGVLSPNPGALPSTPPLNPGVGVLNPNPGAQPTHDIGTTVQDPTNTHNGGNERVVGENASDDITDELPFEAMLYPNPTNDIANIKWNKAMNMELRIVDSKGSLIQTQSIYEGQQSSRVALGQRGVYFLSLTNGETTVWSQKLIKL